MPIDIPNEVLIQCQVPNDRADWETIMRFALTIDGYRVFGSKRLAELANSCRESGRMPENLTALRACLFFEQRRWRHLGDGPDAVGMRHIRALVRAIRQHLGPGSKPPRRQEATTVGRATRGRRSR